MIKNNTLILLTLSISIILKIFFFYHLSTINGDDFEYIQLSNNIFNNFFYSVDAISLHTFYPPGYPLFLGLEKTFLHKWENVFLFNNVIITTSTSLIIFFIIKKHFYNLYNIVFFPIILLYPIFITGRSIINVSSEIFFNLIIWIAIFFALQFFYSGRKYINLFLCNFFFAFLYLIRPEGILFFLFILFYQLLFFKTSFFKFKNIIFPTLSFLFIILPFIIYLYLNLGILTISEKQAVMLYIGENLSNGKLIFRIGNLINLFLFTPNLINPILLPGILLFFFNIMLNKYDALSIKKIFYLLFPAIIFLFILTFKYHLIGRVVYQIIPFIIICSYFGYYQFFIKYKNYYSYTSLIIILGFFASSTIILGLDVNSNHSVLFKNSAKYIKTLPSYSKCILTRDDKLEFYLLNYRIIKLLDEMVPKCKPDYILLSNLTHVGIKNQNLTKYEKENFNKKNIYFQEHDYDLEKIFKRKKYFVKIYKKK